MKNGAAPNRTALSLYKNKFFRKIGKMRYKMKKMLIYIV